MRARSIGGVEVASVVELERVGLPAAMVFPDWSKDLLTQEPQWTTPEFYDAKAETIIVAMQSFLLKTRHHTILVDTCIGNDKPRNNPHFDQLRLPWLERLAATGTRVEDVDFVCCTHMHVDHVGWNTRLDNGRWVPTFPKARYIFAKTEWEHWQRMSKENKLERTGDYVADSVLPIVEAGRADMVATDHEIEDGIRLDPLPGHTPGLVGVHVKNAGGEAIFCGGHEHQLRHRPEAGGGDAARVLRAHRRHQHAGGADAFPRRHRRLCHGARRGQLRIRVRLEARARVRSPLRTAPRRGSDGPPHRIA